MTGLSQEDREALQAVFAGRSTMPGDLKPAVDQIITRHVREALNAAAEAVAPGGSAGAGDIPAHWSAIERLSFLSGMERAARIIRAHHP